MESAVSSLEKEKAKMQVGASWKSVLIRGIVWDLLTF